MKILALMFSAMTVFIIANDLFEQTDFDTKAKHDIDNMVVVLPKVLSLPEQDFEKQWFSLLSKTEDKNESQNPEPTHNKNSLTINEKSFILFGVFSNSGKPFILLKDEGGTPLKLKEGDELFHGTVLKNIESNKVTFIQGEKSLEFKLFERNLNE